MINVYCEKCRDYVGFIEKNVMFYKALGGLTLIYRGKEGSCSECGNVVHVSHLRDFNLAQLHERIKDLKYITE